MRERLRALKPAHLLLALAARRSAAELILGPLLLAKVLRRLAHAGEASLRTSLPAAEAACASVSRDSR